MLKKLAKIKKPKTKYQKKLGILTNEGLKYRAQHDETIQKLSVVESAYDSSKRAWSRQEEQMLNQISHGNKRIEFLDQEISNLREVISGLGEVLGQNKSEIQTLKLFRQRENNFLVASEPKNETERR